jgi:parallel beta-helix repeat protein
MPVHTKKSRFDDPYPPGSRINRRSTRLGRTHLQQRLLGVESLENRRLLASDLTAALQTIIKGSAANGEILVDAIHDRVFLNVLNGTQPLIKDALRVQDGPDDKLKLLTTKVRMALDTLAPLTEVTSAHISSALATQLGMLLGGPIMVTCADPGPECTVGTPSRQVNLSLPLAGVVFEKDVPFDLGLPQLLQTTSGMVHAKLGYTMTLKLGFTEADGIFLDTRSTNDLQMTLNVTSPGLNLTGKLGIMKFNATNASEADPTKFDANYTVQAEASGNAILTVGNLPSLAVTGTRTGHVFLNTQLVFDMGTAIFPTLSSKLLVNWPIDVGSALNAPLASLGQQPTVAFNDVSLNVGTFFANFMQPIVDKIDAALGPIDEIVDILTTRIPVLSDIAVLRNAICGSCSQVTPLGMIAGSTSTVFVDAFRAVQDIVNYVQGVSAAGNAALGSFTINGDVRTISSLATANLNSAPLPPNQQHLNDLRNRLNTHSSLAGIFSIPFLQESDAAFRLIVGKRDVEFLKLDLPTLDGGKSISSPFIPIVGPFGITIVGSFSVKLNLGFGYDSNGLGLWADHNFNPSQIEDVFEGFYLRDTMDGTPYGEDVPEAMLSFDVQARGSLNLVLIEFGVGGGVGGDVRLNLDDPNRDGRVHPREILQRLQVGPLCLFNISGAITAGLTVFARVGIGPFSAETSFDLFRVDIVSFDFPCNANPMALAELDPVTRRLTLNTGPRSEVPTEIEVGGSTYSFVGGDETFKINVVGTDQATGLDILQVQAYGKRQVFNGVASIYAEGGLGNDIIEIAANVRAPATLYGDFVYNPNPNDPQQFYGNDRLIVGRGGGTVFGGPGNDELGGNPDADLLLFLYGDEGNDTIHGSGFRDWLFGGDGDDKLFGSAGNDYLRGGEGLDLLIGGDGDDELEGDDGDDDLRGEVGDDLILGSRGNDILRGGSGNNRLYGSFDDDEIYALDGNDEAYGGEGADFIALGGGNDQAFGEGGDDFIYGEAGADTLAGGNDRDVIDGGDDNDVVHGGAGNDNVWGGDGDDQVSGDDHDDWVYGYSGNDTLRGGTGDDHMFGDAGNDTIHGDAGIDTVRGGIGEDTIDGGTGDDILEGDEGNDRIYGKEDHDLIQGGDGSDQLLGNDGNDTLYGGTGNDIILGDNGQLQSNSPYTWQPTDGNGNDTLSGDDGEDLIYGQGGIDLIRGGRGMDTIFAGIGNDVVHGGADDDLLYGQDGEDSILGDEGNDFLDGELGNDTLQGGAGADRVFGSDGNDLIVGHTLSPGDDNAADVLYGGAGQDVIEGQGGDDFVDGGVGVDTLRGGLGNDTIQAGGGIGDQLFGNDGDDRLVGSDEGSDVDPDFLDPIYFGDVLDGGAGDDTILGLNGADYIVAGGGKDWVDSGPGVDRVRGGDGNDYLYAGRGSGDSIDGEGGNDTIYGSHEGSDLLNGGPGQDSIYGQGGGDTLLGDADDDHLDGGTGTDSIQGGAGNDTLVGGGGVGDQLDGGSGSDVLHGSDDGADVLTGGPGRDSLFGLGGNDSLSGGDADDVLDGGPGDDTLQGDAGADFMRGGAQHDVLYGHSVGGAGDDNAVDDLYGDFGTNQNEAGSGRDRLLGQGGNDRLWGEGDDDFIDAGTGGGDLINYGTGESGVPSDFVPPTPTPPPTVQPGVGISHAGPVLPDGIDSRGLWSELAGSGSGDGVSRSSASAIESSVAVDASNRRYVAWVDSRSGNFEIYVARHVPGMDWQQLPTASGQSASEGGISNSASSSRRPQIAIDNDGNPLVVWTETFGNTQYIYARKFDPAAAGGTGAWIELGASASGVGISVTGSSDSAQVVVTATGPVVAWLDTSSGVSNVYVRRWNGTSWDALGGASYSSGAGLSNSTSHVPDLALATDGSKLSVAWTQPVLGGSQIYLQEFVGFQWLPLANSASGGGLSNLSGGNRTPTVAYHGGQVFVAWQGVSRSRPEIHAQRFNGTAWTSAGAEPVVSPAHSLARHPKLSSRGGTLHLALVDDSLRSSSPNANIMTMRWTGAVFQPFLGQVRAPATISAKNVDTLSLAVDNSGRPFVAWNAPSRNASQVYLRADFSPALATIYYPVNTVQNLLDGGSFGAGQVIYIDVSTPGFTVSPDDSGVTIIASPNATISGPVIVNGANDVILQGITAAQLVTINGGLRNTVRDSKLLGGLSLIGSTDSQVIGNQIECDGVLLSGATRPIAMHNDISVSSVGIKLADGTTDAVIRHNAIRTTTGIWVVSGGGRISDNDIHASVTGLDVNGSFAGTIANNDIHGSTLGVRYNAAAALDGNRIYNNTTGVLARVSSTTTGFGFVLLPGGGDARSNEIFANTVGVRLELGGVMQSQRIHDNSTGVTGTGSLVPADFDHANRIDNNGLGVDVTGPVQFNYLGGNTTGILARSQQLITHNFVFRSLQLGIDVYGATSTRIVSNTIYAPTVDAIRVRGAASEIEFKNNLVWAESGYALHVANDSQVGFWSDYNLLHAGTSGKLVHWSGYDFADILDWQADVAEFDLHSRGRTVVNPGWSEPRFVDAAVNDFRTLELVGQQRATNPSKDAGDPRTDLGLTSVTPANLLANPGFASGLSGWMTNVTATTGSSSPASFDTTPYYRAGTDAVGFAEQTIDLLSQGFTAGHLDSSDLVAVYSGRLRSAVEALPDRGKLIIRFLNAGGGLISEHASQATNVADRWELAGDRVAVPVGTRQVTYRFEAARDTGTVNDAIFDYGFLRVHADTIAHDIGAVEEVDSTSLAESASGAHIALRFPDLYDDWVRDQGKKIRWESFGNTSDAPVRIDLYQDGPHGPAFLTNIVASTPDDGEYDWNPGISGMAFGTHGLRIQVQLVGNEIVMDRATEPFSVPENTTSFFVNDRVTTNDQYTSSAGNNRSTGRLANAPKPLPTTLARVYSLGPTHALSVDNGSYPVFHPLVISNAGNLGDDEGFSMSGPTIAGRTATLVYANPLLIRGPAIELNDADFVTISNLIVDGGQYGIWAHNGSDNFVANNVSISHAQHDGLRFEPTTSGSTLDFISSNANGGYGIYVSGPLNRLADSEAAFNQNTGIHLVNPGAVQFEAHNVHDNRGSGIYLQQFDATAITIGHTNLGLSRGNIVRDNAGHGIDARGNVLVAGNTVSGHRTVFTRGIKLDFGAAQHNVVWDNYDGIAGGVLTHGNRVYKNANTGILVASGTAKENVVYNNAVGLDVVSTSQVSNNLVYANSQEGIRIGTGVAGATLANNTIYQSAGNAIRVNPQVTNLQLRNNVLWVSSGYGVSVPSTSETGFQSDFNLIFATGNGRVGSWQGVDRETLADWQGATRLDQNSMSQNPLFVDADGADNVVGFSNLTNDGRDDDFHEQSLFGSFHGGSLAPVISVGGGVIAGLPSLPTGTLTNDVNQSVVIDRGYALDSFGNEIGPNGGFINLGAYGNTAQASKSPAQYVTVTRPDGGESWPAGQGFNVRWRSHDFAGNVKIELLDQAGAVTSTVANPTANDGEYLWSIPVGQTPGNYRVRVTRLDADMADDASNLLFIIPAPISVYYVNDGIWEAGDWTMAPGNDANSGSAPNFPKATIQDVLDDYDLGPGDTIRVDAGAYNTTTNILIASEDSGVMIEGYHDLGFPTRRAIINRGNTAGGSYGIQFTGADDVTLDHLVVTGGEYGMVALSGADSDRMTITASEIHGNSQGGIYLGGTNDAAQIVGNLVYNQSTAGIQVLSSSGAAVRGNVVRDMTLGIGIEVRGGAGLTAANLVSGNDSYNNTYNIIAGSAVGNSPVTIDNNMSHSGRFIGIQASGGNVLVTNNRVYQNTGTSSTTGIEATQGATVQNNVVHDNVIGIHGSSSTVQNNRVFHNTEIGISEVSATIAGNLVYSQPVGIQGSTGLISGNLVYNSSADGIRIHFGGNGGRIIGNTIYQPIAGNALRVGGLGYTATNVTVRNNIFSVAAGYAIQVDPASQVGFNSDYNALVTTGTGKIGNWSSRDFTSLSDWYFELGLDQHSQTSDPKWVDVDGADNQLGYVGMIDYGADDDFRVLTDSPTIDAGDPSYPFANEPASNGGRVNLGYTGNTSQATTSAAQFVQVLAPNGLEKLERGQVVPITWRISGIAGGTVDIELVNGSGSGTVLNIASGTANDGAESWTIPANLAEGSYRVQVRANQGVLPLDVSDAPFLIVNNGQHFYVNDASTVGDVFTTALGNNANSGRSADQPMASIVALLAAYDLDPGDIVHVDAGTYTLTQNITIGAEDSGVRIEGPQRSMGVPPAAVLNRANTSVGSFAIQLTGADDVTLANLDITGAEYGIVALFGADSDRLSITNSRIRGNAQKGIYASMTSDDLLVANSQFHDNLYGGIYVEYSSGAMIRDNLVYNNTLGRGIELFSPASATATGVGATATGNESYGHGTGIFASNGGTGSVTVSNNIVHDNRDTGIDAGTNVQVIGNTVSRTRTGFGSGSGAPLGIRVSTGSVARDNVVFDNIRGIQSFDSTAINNRVFHNDLVGISGHFNANIQGNTVYSNGVGIWGTNLTGRIASNLVYANANDGIWLNSSTGPRIEGNTVYQDTTGDAVQVGGTHPEFFVGEFPVTGAIFVNNIFHVAQGYALHVAATSSVGFASDYNDFSLAGTGKLARWEDRDFTNREDWYFEIGADSHGIIADPQFIDVDGPDNGLGYDVGTNTDRGLDDNFRVAVGSPTIDRGDPRTASAGEPLPNGGRVNLGHTGDTQQAQVSPTQFVQVLSPNGLEKYEIGQNVRIDWRSSGITQVAPIALIDAGGLGADPWTADRYKVAGQTFSFTDPVNLSGVVNPAPAATYQNGTYGGFGVGNRVAYQFPVSDGSYALRLHFVEPALSGPGQRPFDIRINGTTVQSNFDIFTAAGGAFKATTLTFSASAASGQGIALEMVNPFNGYGAYVAGIELAAANPGGSANAMVNLEYSFTNGFNWNTIATNVPLDLYGGGSYIWTPNAETTGNAGLIRITPIVGGPSADVSDAAFLVSNSGRDFYVNDNSTANDTFTSVAGNNLASGKRPEEPMASLAALLAAYDLNPLDVVHVDRGSYRLYRNLVIGTEDSGVRIEGASGGTGVPPVSILNRGNILPGNYTIELAGADDVTIDRLAITGATVGVYAPANSQSDRLALTNNDIYGNTITLGGAFAYGIYIDRGNDDGRIAGNQVHNNVSAGNTGTGIYASALRTLIEDNEAFGQSTGIEIQSNLSALPSDWATVRGNTVHDNTVAGIYAIQNATVTGNTAFNHLGVNRVGIHVILAAASDNVAYDNTTGIISDRSTTSNNRVYRNSVGIDGRQYGTIDNNHVYSNAIGITGGAGFYGHILSNLVYGNTNQGIYIQSSFFAGLRIVNNTVYQPVGEAIRIENTSQGITLRNNIASVDTGHAIYVAPNSQNGFSSNYNLFHTNSSVGYWNGVAQSSLNAWQTATGQDANSLASDPLWVDRDGPDNVLGYTIASGGYDGGLDDNFHLRGGSPAIDRADSTLSPTLDRGGFPRIDDPGTANGGIPAGLSYVDLGAYEFQGSSNDVTPPTVLNSTIQTTRLEGGLAHRVHLTLSEPLDALDALSIGHYEFRAAGLNGTFGDTDDVVFTLTPQYTVGATTLTLDVASGGAALPAGLFRLTVFATMHDASGNTLDGDQNGSPGGDYARINDRPVLSAVANQTVSEGQPLVFVASATDGGSVTYSLASGAPAGASIHPVTGEFTWTPTEAQGPGQFTISVIATDGGSPSMNDLHAFTVSVVEVNAAPVIDAISNKTVVRGTPLTFTVTASDPDTPANSIAFSLATGAPAGASIHPVTGVFSWTPPANQAQGHYDITVLAGDNGAPPRFGSKSFRVTVYPIAPTLADFNNDGLLDAIDVDALVGQIAMHTNASLYDLTGDGLVNLADRDLWLAAAGAANLNSGNPYRLGDANLDGIVDGSDFGIWNSNKFTGVARWSRGDFNADGFVDGSDFGIWNSNKFTSSDTSGSRFSARSPETDSVRRKAILRREIIEDLFAQFGIPDAGQEQERANGKYA